MLSPSVPFRPPAPLPQPRPLGAFALLRALRRNPLECWTAAHFEEPIVEGGFPFARVAVVSDPEAIHEVLVEHPSEYPKSALERRVLSAWLRNGLVVAEGEQWQRQRRTLAPVMNRKVALGFAPSMAAAAAALVARWRRDNADVIDLKREMSRLALDVLLRCMFVGEPGENLEAVRRAMTTFFAVSGRVDPFDILGLPDAVPRLTLLRARAIFHASDGVLDAAIARRRERNSGPAGDMLGHMMAAEDPHTGRPLETAEVKANMLTAFFAGQETTSTALTWSLYLLSQSPEWSDRVRRESEQIADVPADDLERRLVTTRAVAKEALRLYPPIVGITRTLRRRRTLARRDLKPGTMIVISPYVLHRHRRLWNAPDVFDPSRFLEGARRPVERHAYLPFGVGPRMCIGAAFALDEMSLVLAAILKNFTVALAPDQTVWPVQRFTLRPREPLLMRITRRD